MFKWNLRLHLNLFYVESDIELCDLMLKSSLKYMLDIIQTSFILPLYYIT